MASFATLHELEKPLNEQGGWLALFLLYKSSWIHMS